MGSYTIAAATFGDVSNIFHENRLSWGSFVGVSVHEPPAISGLHSRFITKVKEKHPSVVCLSIPKLTQLNKKRFECSHQDYQLS